MNASRESRYFLDTNIFVYTFDDRDLSKRDRARSLVESALQDQNGVISFQVIGEFLNVATTRFAVPLSFPDCAAYIDSVMSPLCEVHSSVALYLDALDIQERWRFSWYDSLIVAAALEADCELLLSEDLQHGQKIRDLRIENPFASQEG